jgi:thiamine pyrophosphokinase
MAEEHVERVVVVFTGGDPVDAALRGRLPEGAFVIAADSGVSQAAALRYPVDVAVGDFDSVDPVALAALEAKGTRIERHPAAKDATDLELGLVAAAAHGATRVIVVGGHGGRVDHFLANALVLTSPAFAAMQVEALVGPARLVVVTDRAQLGGEPGDLVTLLPVGGAAVGVRTTGLLYPLAGEDLAPGTTRGVSNEFAAPDATVSVEAGTILVVQPGLPGTHLVAGIATSTTIPERTDDSRRRT